MVDMADVQREDVVLACEEPIIEVGRYGATPAHDGWSRVSRIDRTRGCARRESGRDSRGGEASWACRDGHCTASGCKVHIGLSGEKFPCQRTTGDDVGQRDSERRWDGDGADVRTVPSLLFTAVPKETSLEGGGCR